MKRFVEGVDRDQATLFPKCLEDWVDENNAVRVIEAFVEGRDLGGLGFSGVDPQATGRPAYHPSVLLKLYIYGYLTRVHSSRRQEPSPALDLRTTRLKEKIAKLKKEMKRLEALEVERRKAPDRQISLTDPDARSMATSGRGSGVVGYNVQAAADTRHHLIVAHEVINEGNDRSQLSPMFEQAKTALEVDKLEAVADRGYFDSEEILACDRAGIAVTLPKPLTSGAKAEGRFGKQDFRYLTDEDVYICPSGQRLGYRYTREEAGLAIRRYWTNLCPDCPIKALCTPSKQRRISRWEHEEGLEAVQRRLDENPEAVRRRSETVERPFGTIKSWMGATHFLTKRLKNVRTEMALSVLAYNLARVVNILGTGPLLQAIRA